MLESAAKPAITNIIKPIQDPTSLPNDSAASDGSDESEDSKLLGEINNGDQAYLFSSLVMTIQTPTVVANWNDPRNWAVVNEVQPTPVSSFEDPRGAIMSDDDIREMWYS